jgi:hypothetical protein
MNKNKYLVFFFVGGGVGSKIMNLNAKRMNCMKMMENVWFKILGFEVYLQEK